MRHYIEIARCAGMSPSYYYCIVDGLLDCDIRGSKNALSVASLAKKAYPNSEIKILQ